MISLTLLHMGVIVGGHWVFGALSPLDYWLLIIEPTVTFFVTFMIEKYQENQAIREQVHQSEKLRAVSELAASVSHEIRNPMTVVRGFVQLMKQDTELNPKYQSYLKLSMSELDRAEKIITDYLTFARPSISKIECVPVDEEIKYVTSMLNPFSNFHRVSFEVSIIHQGFVQGDRLKLRQALINIIKNGIEAMPEGGTLRVQLQRVNDPLCINISDTGIGMSLDQIKRLGTAYYSLKEKGTGLGTMVSFKFIESMCGKITVDSQIGKGTTFSIYFPNYAS